MGVVNSPEDRTQGAEPAVVAFLRLSGVSEEAETGLAIDAVRQLLFKWRDEDPGKFVQDTGLGREKFYYFAGGPKLATFGALAACAAALDSEGHWSRSPRMEEVLSAWMDDSVELGRSAPVAHFVAMAELARVVDPNDTYSSTSNALKALPLNVQVAEALVRYEPVNFEKVTDGIAALTEQLGTGAFPEEFEKQWRQIQSAAVNPLAGIAARFAELNFDTAFIAEVLEVRASKRTATVSRALSGEYIAPVVAPGVLQLMANPYPELLRRNLEGHMVQAFNERRCKGRKAPHVSAVIRDVFGIRPERVGIISKEAVTSLEQDSEASRVVFDGSRAAAERRVARVLNRLIDQMESRGVLSTVAPLPDVMRRLKESTMGDLPGIGRARLKAAINGEYVPPLSVLKTALSVEELPAWLEVDARLRFADQMVQEGRTPIQRLLVQLATEEHESISAFRKAHDTADNPWSKGSWDKFYGNLGDSVIHNETHLDRALSFLAPAGVEGDFTRALLEQFQEQISVTGGQDYVAVACSLFSHLGHLRDMVETGLASFKHVFRQSTDSGRRVPTMKLGELLQELREVQEKVPAPYRSELHERALPVLRMLPGISTCEVKAIIGSMPVEEVVGAIPHEQGDAERVTLLDLLGPGISSIVEAGAVAPAPEPVDSLIDQVRRLTAIEEPDPPGMETDSAPVGDADSSAPVSEPTDLFDLSHQTTLPEVSRGTWIYGGDGDAPAARERPKQKVDPIATSEPVLGQVDLPSEPELFGLRDEGNEGGTVNEDVPSETTDELGENQLPPVGEAIDDEESDLPPPVNGRDSAEDELPHGRDTQVAGAVNEIWIGAGEAAGTSIKSDSSKQKAEPVTATDAVLPPVDPPSIAEASGVKEKGEEKAVVAEDVLGDVAGDPGEIPLVSMVEDSDLEEAELQVPIDEQDSGDDALFQGTGAPPGSEEKLRIMRERYAKSLPLHRDEDRKEGDERFEDIDLR